MQSGLFSHFSFFFFCIIMSLDGIFHFLTEYLFGFVQFRPILVTCILSLGTSLSKDQWVNHLAT